VYRVPGGGPTDPCNFTDATYLIATVRASGTGGSYVDTTASSTATYTYHVTGLDRLHHESQLSAGRVVGSGGGTPEPGVIVDNATAGAFTASANWSTSSFSSQRFGADYRFGNPDTTASDPAWYRANLARTGSYRVEIWYPADAGYNSATPFLIATSTGTQTVVVDQRTGGGAWRSIGTFTLAAGDRNVVGISRWTTGTGYVIADAVRITPVP
jgi:hypothetical protein